MKTLLSLSYFHRLDFSLLVLEDMKADAWIGAVIRNNLLYSTRQIRMKYGSSFYSEINTLPLSENHPLFNEISGGFPKGCIFLLTSHVDDLNTSLSFHKNDRITFSIVLFGSCAKYYDYFTKAVKLMCDRGIGKPRAKMLLLDVFEHAGDGSIRPILHSGTGEVFSLSSPVYLKEFNTIPTDHSFLTVRYDTPTLLFSKRSKKDTANSYQDKLGGFPSFYQLMRSVLYRILKLTALYIIPDDEKAYIAGERKIESFLKEASDITLISADLRRFVMRSTQKKGTDKRIMLPGYVGETVFEGDFSKYLKILLYARNLGIGKDTSYGLGSFDVKTEKYYQD